MPTSTKVIPLSSYNRLRVIRCEGEVYIAKEFVNFDGDEWHQLSRIDITQDQAVGLAMALIEGTGFKVTK